MDEKEQELLFKLSAYEQQINHLGEQAQAVEKGVNELSSLTESLNDLVKSEGKEIFAPLGRGIFIKSKVLSEDLLVDVGGKNLVKKNIPQTQEMIKEQIEKLEEIKNEIDLAIDKTSKEVEKVISNAKEETN
ncbi:prefoldin subunit alpha [Candidatus Pacearchaeota archaeon]|nr:prefoldin subunit alpha [Candidatus Pacearchaeota archaeon]